jgi:hypothetical protein
VTARLSCYVAVSYRPHCGAPDKSGETSVTSRQSDLDAGLKRGVIEVVGDDRWAFTRADVTEGLPQNRFLEWLRLGGQPFCGHATKTIARAAISFRAN